MPMMIFMSVLFPAPLPPISTSTSPAWTGATTGVASRSEKIVMSL